MLCSFKKQFATIKLGRDNSARSGRQPSRSNGATKIYRTIMGSVVQGEVAVAIDDRGFPSKTHTLGSDRDCRLTKW
jgi:hypothetical protein